MDPNLRLMGDMSTERNSGGRWMHTQVKGHDLGGQRLCMSVTCQTRTKGNAEKVELI